MKNREKYKNELVDAWRFPMTNRDRMIEALRGTVSMNGRRRYE